MLLRSVTRATRDRSQNTETGTETGKSIPRRTNIKKAYKTFRPRLFQSGPSDSRLRRGGRHVSVPYFRDILYSGTTRGTSSSADCVRERYGPMKLDRKSDASRTSVESHHWSRPPISRGIPRTRGSSIRAESALANRSPQITENGRSKNCTTSADSASVSPSALCIWATTLYAAPRALSRSGQSPPAKPERALD